MFKPEVKFRGSLLKQPVRSDLEKTLIDQGCIRQRRAWPVPCVCGWYAHAYIVSVQACADPFVRKGPGHPFQWNIINMNIAANRRQTEKDPLHADLEANRQGQTGHPDDGDARLAPSPASNWAWGTPHGHYDWMDAHAPFASLD